MTYEKDLAPVFCHATAKLATAEPAVHLIQEEWNHEELASSIAAWFEETLAHLITLDQHKTIRRLFIRFGIIAAKFLQRDEHLEVLHEIEPELLGEKLLEHIRKFD